MVKTKDEAGEYYDEEDYGIEDNEGEGEEDPSLARDKKICKLSEEFKKVWELCE